MEAINLTQGAMNAVLNKNGQSRINQAADRLENLDPAKRAEVKSAAEDFEAVFISQMMSYMFESVEVDPVFGGGQGEEMFRGMMVQEYGKQLAARGGIGIAEHVQAKLIELQAAAGKM